MKRVITNIIQVIIFILIFMIIFIKINDILRVKVHTNDTIGSFYKERSDSIDVIFVGSSHAFSSFSPMELWDDYGITSYNLSTGCQSLPCSYYLMKEAIRTQHPKVVVLETYASYYMTDYISTARVHQAIDCIPLNQTKFEILTDYLSDTMSVHERLEYVFPIALYHSRWKELKKNDIRPKKTYLRGYYTQLHINEQQEIDLSDEVVEVYEKNISYIEKMIHLCEKNDVELIMCQTPIAKNKDYKNICGRMKTIENYAVEQGISYINYDKLRDILKLDYKVDFADSKHLNIIGASKTTSYMGDYLKTHYELADHRNETDYDNWVKDCEFYKKYIHQKKEEMLSQRNQ
ncbi:MAG: hypothetical protein IJ801_02110 [Lachnospiraceae bacterium]|nr:hypothetical protein [Lachnospiraceae bacterium]